MAGRMFQQMKDMVPYEGKMKFKDPTSSFKVTVEVNKPKTGGAFSRFKGHFKKRDTKAQMQDGTGSLHDARSYQNIPERVSAHRESYRRATGGAYSATRHHPNEGFSPLEDVPCRSGNSLECFQEQGVRSAQLPAQPPVIDRGNREQRPAMPPPIPPHGRSRAVHQNEGGEILEDEYMYRSTVQLQSNLKQQRELDMPPPIPPRGRSQALHQADPYYGNEEEIYDIYDDAHMSTYWSSVQQQLNLKQQKELRMPPPIPPPNPPPILPPPSPRESKPATNQVDSENGFEIYGTTNQSTAQDQSLSNRQESSDAKKIMHASDDSSDDDTFGEELMKSYVELQAKRALGDNTIDADGYTSVIPRTTEEYINCGFAPTSKNPPLPKHGQVWLTWTADGREVRLPVNIAEKEQAAESGLYL